MGARFGTLDDIWNIGATAFYDYGMSADADGRGADLLLVDSISVGYTMFGATLDNYVRVYSDKGSSLFLVGGVGYANVGQSVEITNAGQTDSQSESEGAIVAKIGGIYNFDTNWGMTFGVRAAMPENLTLVNYEIGLRYTF